MFDFYFKISSRIVDNWVRYFSDSSECRDELKNCLSIIHNQRLSGNRYELLRTRFSMPAKAVLPGSIDVLSEWSSLCRSWDYVDKTWRLSVHNKRDQSILLKDSLIYPVPYWDAELVRSRFFVEAGKVAENNHGVQLQIKLMGSPVHSKAIVIDPGKGVKLGPGEVTTLEIEFRHSGYFQRVAANKWVHSGKISYLDYPGFADLNVVQRVKKEYVLSKELTRIGDTQMRIDFTPPCDWSEETNGNWVLGYGRFFEIATSLPIFVLVEA